MLVTKSPHGTQGLFSLEPGDTVWGSCQLWRGEMSEIHFVYWSTGQTTTTWTQKCGSHLKWYCIDTIQTVMMTHLWEFDERLRHWDTPSLTITRSGLLTMSPPPGHSILLTTMMEDKHRQNICGWCHVSLRKSHEKYTRNLKCEIEDRAWNVFRCQTSDPWIIIMLNQKQIKQFAILTKEYFMGEDFIHIFRILDI